MNLIKVLSWIMLTVFGLIGIGFIADFIKSFRRYRRRSKSKGYKG